MKKSKRGGKRTGAGRPPSADPNISITLLVRKSVADKLGGKEGVAIICHDAIRKRD